MTNRNFPHFQHQETHHQTSQSHIAKHCSRPFDREILEGATEAPPSLNENSFAKLDFGSQKYNGAPSVVYRKASNNSENKYQQKTCWFEMIQGRFLSVVHETENSQIPPGADLYTIHVLYVCVFHNLPFESILYSSMLPRIIRSSPEKIYSALVQLMGATAKTNLANKGYEP